MLHHNPTRMTHFNRWTMNNLPNELLMCIFEFGIKIEEYIFLDLRLICKKWFWCVMSEPTSSRLIILARSVAGMKIQLRYLSSHEYHKRKVFGRIVGNIRPTGVLLPSDATKLFKDCLFEWISLMHEGDPILHNLILLRNCVSVIYCRCTSKLMDLCARRNDLIRVKLSIRFGDDCYIELKRVCSCAGYGYGSLDLTSREWFRVKKACGIVDDTISIKRINKFMKRRVWKAFKDQRVDKYRYGTYGDWK